MDLYENAPFPKDLFFCRYATVKKCLVQITQVEFPTHIWVQRSVALDVFFQHKFQFEIGFAATWDGNNLNADRKDMKSPETRH